jgi:hypothetical protein
MGTCMCLYVDVDLGSCGCVRQGRRKVQVASPYVCVVGGSEVLGSKVLALPVL